MIQSSYLRVSVHRDTVPVLFVKRSSTNYRVGIAHVVFGSCSGPLSSKSANPKSSGQLDLLTCLPPIERRCVVVKYLVCDQATSVNG